MKLYPKYSRSYMYRQEVIVFAKKEFDWVNIHCVNSRATGRLLVMMMFVNVLVYSLDM